MILEKSLFLIYTPYQLISSINLIKTYRVKNVDVILLNNNLKQFEELVKKQIDGNLISAEYLKICNRKINISQRINLLIDIIYMKRMIKKDKNIPENYSQLFVPSGDIACRVVYNKLRRYSNSLELNLYDDGLGTYIKKIFFKKTFLGELAYNIFLDPDYTENINNIYCYCPELVENDLKSHNILRINNEETTKKVFESIVHKSCKDYIGKKVIFLDQGFSNMQPIRECLEILKKYINSEDIIIKKHPRIESNIDYTNYKVLKDGIPIEMIINTFNCTNTLLISEYSTGCISPFYLIKKNYPYAVMLYKIKNKNDSNMLIEFTNFINKINLEKNNVITLPESIIDFENFIKNNYEKFDRVKEF